jgi:hypothetical protein
VSRSASGIGALLYVFEWCMASFWRTVKTPVGVWCPGLPVLALETPMSTPFR